MAKILIVEDETSIRNVLVNIISEESPQYEVHAAEDAKRALELLKEHDFDLMLSDIKMPGMDGIELLERVVILQPECTVVMISGHGDIETAVDSIKKGAYDYISKPPDLNRLLNTVRNALDKSQLVVENKRLKKKISRKYTMIGASPAIQQIADMIDRVAPSDARVLITGPNGTGKELVAHQIHERSARSGKPFIEVNCAAIPSELIESELFGHEKGAFTSAHKQRAGKFEAAHGGTLFLDEIGDMSLSAQSKVLRALQENRITRVGSDKEIQVDVRILAATNKNLKSEIEAGRFREDLYHRLAVILIEVPSLADRLEDVPLLAEHFLQILAAEQGTAPKVMEPDAVEALKQKPWSGNIREFRNVMERLTILCDETITAADVAQFAG